MYRTLAIFLFIALLAGCSSGSSGAAPSSGGSSSAPDLVWRSSDIFPVDSIYLSGSFYFLQLEFANNGATASTPCVCRFLVDGAFFDEVDLPAVASNDIYRIDLSLYLPDLEPGTYTVDAILDYNDTVNEVSNANNKLSDVITFTASAG